MFKYRKEFCCLKTLFTQNYAFIVNYIVTFVFPSSSEITSFNKNYEPEECLKVRKNTL